MAFVELLKVTHGVDNKVTAVDVKVMGVDDKVDGVGREIQEVHDDVQDVGNKVQNVEGRVQAIHGNVQDVSTKVQGVDSRVQGMGSDIKEISNEVQGVDEKLDQVNRSSSLLPLLVIPRPQTASQGDCSEINCYNGFRRQIHPLIITLHAKTHHGMTFGSGVASAIAASDWQRSRGWRVNARLAGLGLWLRTRAST